MKIAVKANKAPRAILEHTKDTTLGVTVETEGVMVEDVLHDVLVDLPVINTCIGVKVLETSDEKRAIFRKEFGFVDQEPVSFLYGFLSRDKCSDLMEMVVSGKFMSGNIGKDVGFIQGTAIPCSEDVYRAFPTLEGLIDALHILEYQGEICIGVTRDFQICSMTAGHCTGAWSLFTELAQQSPQETLEFCFDKRQACKLHADRVATCTLLSYPPYPYTNTVPFSVLAPRTAEKHLYRFNDGSCELSYAAASGSRIFEARRRVKRTTDNCSKYNPELQYRVDYGKYLTFTLMQDRYRELGG